MIKIKEGSVVKFKSRKELNRLRGTADQFESGVGMPSHMLDNIMSESKRNNKIIVSNIDRPTRNGHLRFYVNTSALRSWVFTTEMIEPFELKIPISFLTATI